MKRLWGRGETLTPTCKFGGDLSEELVLEFGSEGEEVIQAVKKKEEFCIWAEVQVCKNKCASVHSEYGGPLTICQYGNIHHKSRE